MEDISLKNDWEVLASVTISMDKMMATLLLPKLDVDIDYNLQDIVDYLKRKGVIQGIDIAAIQRILDNEEFGEDVCVARGREVVQGTDGRFEFDFKTDLPRFPQEDVEGDVDYREVALIDVVKEGQQVARYIPATRGEFGFTVTGELMIPKSGKELRPLRGKGMTISDDKRTYYAALDGTVILHNERLEINRALIINGNVDATTGHLDYDGSIYIYGDVLSGMKINATGDVHICGYVENAVISCGGDVVIQKGMRGNGIGYISAQGGVFGSFFDGVKIRAKHDVEANAFINCKVDTPRKVYATGSNGTISGGRIHAIKGVKTINCGISSDRETILESGISQESMYHYNVLRKEIIKIDSEIKVFESGKSSFEEKLSMMELSDHGVYIKILQAIQIKKKEKQESMERLQDLLQRLSTKEEVKVQVDGTIHPGVTVIIDTYELKLNRESSKVYFVRDDNHVIMKKAK